MSFGDFVRRCRARGTLMVQPRMGFGDPGRMRAGLIATKQAAASTVGTITLDSYTRLGDLDSADRALREGIELNGYPLVSHSARTTADLIEGLISEDFPIQVRHGSARPLAIFEAMFRTGLYATEGGPISYCLPYGRTPVEEALRDWTRSCELAAQLRESGIEPHLETFGGCMMGQLCPPSLLVAISVLEACYFKALGFRSISVSYAQQTNLAQDREAVHALRRLCAELLADTDWHVVLYAYMGVFPRTAAGARGLLADAARLAVATGSERLIVKTVAESHRIPTIAENIEALELAASVAAALPRALPRHDPAFGAAPSGGADHAAGRVVDGDGDGGQVYQEAYALVEAVLSSGAQIGPAMVAAVKRGVLDVPYCVHPDNAGRTRSYLGADGRLEWAQTGAMPLGGLVDRRRRPEVLTSAGLMAALSYVQRTYDARALEQAGDRRLTDSGRALQTIRSGGGTGQLLRGEQA